MPVITHMQLDVLDVRRSIAFHRAVGIPCQEPQEGDNALFVSQLNRDMTRMMPVRVNATSGTISVRVELPDRIAADAMFDRTVAAGARATGACQYQDLDGHTWILEVCP